MGHSFYVSDIIMDSESVHLHFVPLDQAYQILLRKVNENAELDEMKKMVNSILPVKKYSLMHKFLAEEQMLSEEIRLKCLSIFLDENTNFFSFLQYTTDQNTIRSILEIIPRCSPNIKIVDFRCLNINSETKESFKSFLRQMPRLLSLKVKCLRDDESDSCAIKELLLDEDFSQHDDHIRKGLLKINFIDGFFLTPSDCAKLLNLLPNLESVGISQKLGPGLSDYIQTNNSDRILKITEIHDSETTMTSLNEFLRFCPNTKRIFLLSPDQEVLENLWKFPSLIDIKLFQFNFNLSSLNVLIQKNGRRIKKLDISCFNDIETEPHNYLVLFPELKFLRIKGNNLHF